MKEEKSVNQQATSETQEPSMEDILASIRQVMEGAHDSSENTVDDLINDRDGSSSIDKEKQASVILEPEVEEEPMTEQPKEQASEELMNDDQFDVLETTSAQEANDQRVADVEDNPEENLDDDILDLTEIIDDGQENPNSEADKAPTVAEMLEAAEIKSEQEDWDQTSIEKPSLGIDMDIDPNDLVFDEVIEEEIFTDENVANDEGVLREEMTDPTLDTSQLVSDHASSKKSDEFHQSSRDVQSGEEEFSTMGQNMDSNNHKNMKSHQQASSSEEWLVSEESAADSADSLARIASIVDGARHVNLGHGNKTVEDITKELLKPLMKTWLDENLPSIVDSLVRQEINRLISRLERR